MRKKTFQPQIIGDDTVPSAAPNDHALIDADVFRLQENDYLQECLEVVQQEFMIFNREK